MFYMQGSLKQTTLAIVGNLLSGGAAPYGFLCGFTRLSTNIDVGIQASNEMATTLGQVAPWEPTFPLPPCSSNNTPTIASSASAALMISRLRPYTQSSRQLSVSLVSATFNNAAIQVIANLLIVEMTASNAFPVAGLLQVSNVVFSNTSLLVDRNVLVVAPGNSFWYSSQCYVVNVYSGTIANGSSFLFTENVANVTMPPTNTTSFIAFTVTASITPSSTVTVANNSAFCATIVKAALGRSIAGVLLEVLIIAEGRGSAEPQGPGRSEPLVRITGNAFLLHKPSSAFMGCNQGIISCLNRVNMPYLDPRQPMSAIQVGLTVMEGDWWSDAKSSERPPVTITSNVVELFDLLASPSSEQSYTSAFELTPSGVPATCTGIAYNSTTVPHDETVPTPFIVYNSYIAETVNPVPYNATLRRPARYAGFNVTTNIHNFTGGGSPTASNNRLLVDLSDNLVGYRMLTSSLLPPSNLSTFEWYFREAAPTESGYAYALAACRANTSIAHTLFSTAFAYDAARNTTAMIVDGFRRSAEALPSNSVSLCGNWMRWTGNMTKCTPYHGEESEETYHAEGGRGQREEGSCFPKWLDRPNYATPVNDANEAYNMWVSATVAANLTYNAFTTLYNRSVVKCLATASSSASSTITHTLRATQSVTQSSSQATTDSLHTTPSATPSLSQAATVSCDTQFMEGTVSVCDVLSPLGAAFTDNTTTMNNTKGGGVCQWIGMALPYGSWEGGANTTLEFRLVNELMNEHLLQPGIEANRQLGSVQLSAPVAPICVIVPTHVGESAVGASDLEVSAQVSTTLNTNATSNANLAPPLTNHSDLRVLLTLRYVGSKTLTGQTVDVAVPSNLIYLSGCVFPFSFVVRVHLADAAVSSVSEKLDQVTLSVVAAGSVMTAMPQGVIRASMIASLRDMLRCNVVDPFAKPSLLSNPLEWSFGDAYGGYMRGSLLMGATVVMCSVLVVGAIGATLFCKYVHEPHQEGSSTANLMWKGARGVMFPSILLVPVVVANEMAVSSAFTLISMPYASDGDVVAGVAVCLCTAIYCIHVLVVCFRARIDVVPNPDSEPFPRWTPPLTFPGSLEAANDLEEELQPMEGATSRSNKDGGHAGGDGVGGDTLLGESMNLESSTTSTSANTARNFSFNHNFSFTNDDDVFHHHNSSFLKPSRSWPIRVIRFLFVPTHIPRAQTEVSRRGARRTRASARSSAEWMHYYGLYASEMSWLPYRGLEVAFGTVVNAFEGFVVEGKTGCAARSFGTLIVLLILLTLAIHKKPYSLRIQLWFTIGYLALLASAAGIICANIWELSVEVENVAGVILDMVSIAVGLQSALDIIMFVMLLLPFVRKATGMKRSTIAEATSDLRDEADKNVDEEQERESEEDSGKENHTTQLDVPPTPQTSPKSNISDITLEPSPPPSPALLPSAAIKLKRKTDDDVKNEYDSTGIKILTGMTRNEEEAARLRAAHLEQERDRLAREALEMNPDASHVAFTLSSLTSYRRHQQRHLHNAFMGREAGDDDDGPNPHDGRGAY